MPQNINTNLSSLVGLRQLSQTQTNLNRILEKVASGQRINSARDDAAGLAIANRFTSQINGLTVASRNASDGISLAQTTESALEETTTALQRIRELSLQAANGTLNASDRNAIQQEIDQLKQEVDRIADTTTFNGKRVLDGSLAEQSFQIGANAGETVQVSGFDARSSALGGLPGALQSSGSRATLGSTDLGNQGIQEGDADTPAITDLSIQVSSGTAVNIADDANGGAIASVAASAELTDPDAQNYGSGLAKSIAERINTLRQSGTEGLENVYASARTEFNTNDVASADFSGSVNTSTATNVAAGALSNGDLNINGVDIGPAQFSENDGNGSLTNAINARSDVTGVTASINAQGELQLRAGDGRDIVVTTSSAAVSNRVFGGGENRFSERFQDLRVSGEVTVSAEDSLTFGGTDVASAGLDALQEDNVQATGSVASIDVSTVAGAQSSVESIDSALNRIDSYRASLGAIQNRFESSIRNLSSVSEAQTAARSRIADTDFASQITALSREQIKRQAGLALQAQANALSQQILSLLA
ncbi:flagellin [Ketobacter sp.]|uniref:flagellin N-terminal helical domain-containing protein n=1 Tax=Ketobacter sp. TaxID=2083498 RepID=UPI000F21DC62|nr:flagellin [Ketobacter sp.]RLU01586.1 MAG: flagellin [Ketobacter sp.]